MAVILIGKQNILWVSATNIVIKLDARENKIVTYIQYIIYVIVNKRSGKTFI